MVKDVFENEYCKLWIKDNILYSIFRPYLEVTVQTARIWASDRITFTQGITYPMLADISNTKFLTIQAKDFLETKEAWTNVSAVAYLATTQTEKMMWSMFLKLNNPPIPSCIFINKAQALEWLKDYK